MPVFRVNFCIVSPNGHKWPINDGLFEVKTYDLQLIFAEIFGKLLPALIRKLPGKPLHFRIFLETDVPERGLKRGECVVYQDLRHLNL